MRQVTLTDEGERIKGGAQNMFSDFGAPYDDDDDGLP